MPTGPRFRDNGIFGTTTDNPLTAGAGTFNSAGLSGLSVISAAHAVVTLDPLKQFGAPEIVVVTAHTAAATVATITRGQYGTTARSHPLGTLWTHAAVDEDFMEIVTTGTLPGNPYGGQPVFDRTLDAPFLRNAANTAWNNFNMYADPPACRVFHNTTQSIADNTETTVAFNSESYDNAGMHDNVTNNSRITFTIAGRYLVEWNFQFAADTDFLIIYNNLRKNGTTKIWDQRFHVTNILNDTREMAGATVKTFAVNDYVELRAYQDNSSNNALNLTAMTTDLYGMSATWMGRG